MRKEITFTDSANGLVPVAVYYDADNNEFDIAELKTNVLNSQKQKLRNLAFKILLKILK